MALPVIVSAKDLSVVLSIGRRQVNRLTEMGILVSSGRDQFELAASVVGYVGYRERLVEQRLGGGDSYASARTLKTREQALEAQTRRLEREGSLLPIEDVERTWSAIFASVKTRLLAIPNRAVPKLMKAKVAAEMGAVLRKELCRVLDGLGASTPAATRFGVRAGGVERGNGRPREQEELSAEGSHRAPRAVDVEPGSDEAARAAASARGAHRRGAARAR